MANNRNGMDLSGVPHGLAGPVFPMTFDGSGVTAPIDNQCPGSTSLASTLAYATPENQRMDKDELYNGGFKLYKIYCYKISFSSRVAKQIYM
ncbi:hypothetical protein P8452_75146 [Trifolium repens]|nr:hypothetical protein P8452_75146 [Trifolium repens]